VKKNFLLMTLCFVMILGLSFSAQAIWWLFGDQEMPPQVRNVYIGNARGINIEEQLIITQDQLIDDQLVIRGSAYSQKAPIAQVLVSFDRGENWDTATIAKPGNNVSFIYEFEVEAGQEYEIAFQAVDLQGMKSEVWDSGYYSVLISERSIEEIIEEILNEMARAYASEDLYGFMNNVALEYRSGLDILEDAIRSDFASYQDISVDLSIFAVNPTRSGYEITVDWTQGLTEVETGENINRDGLTSFYFTSANQLELMRGDVLFGFTSERITEESGSDYDIDSGYSGRFTLTGPAEGPYQGFDFAMEQVIDNLTYDDLPWDGQADLIYDFGDLNAPNGIIKVDAFSIEEVTQAPNRGYKNYEDYSSINEGDVFVVICSFDNWAVIEVESVKDVSEESEPIFIIEFRYKYYDSKANLDSDYMD
jgi:hypothetical protein